MDTAHSRTVPSNLKTKTGASKNRWPATSDECRHRREASGFARRRGLTSPRESVSRARERVDGTARRHMRQNVYELSGAYY